MITNVIRIYVDTGVIASTFTKHNSFVRIKRTNEIKTGVKSFSKSYLPYVFS